MSERAGRKESVVRVLDFVISEVTAGSSQQRPALGSDHVANMEQKKRSLLVKRMRELEAGFSM